MPALKPRDGYQAISIEEIPQGAKVNPNGGKGAIVKGVRGLCKQSGVGSDDSYSVTVRVLPEMKDSISHFVETENRPRAAVVREAIELGLLLKQKGLTVDDILESLIATAEQDTNPRSKDVKEAIEIGLTLKGHGVTLEDVKETLKK